MQTLAAREAKTNFGEYLDAVQRAPVVITKNNRPVAITVSITDAADSLIPELFMEKEDGYEAWFEQKVTAALGARQSRRTKLTPHAAVLDQVWNRVKGRSAKASA